MEGSIQKKPSYIETYNDLTKKLVNLFILIRDNLKEYTHRNGSLYSRTLYKDAVKRFRKNYFREMVVIYKKNFYNKCKFKKVEIECLDVEAEHYFNVDRINYKSKDHIRLANILKEIRRKFILSYYDHEFVRRLYNQ